MSCRARIFVLLFATCATQSAAWWWDVVRSGDPGWLLLLAAWVVAMTLVCALGARDLAQICRPADGESCRPIEGGGAIGE